MRMSVMWQTYVLDGFELAKLVTCVSAARFSSTLPLPDAKKEEIAVSRVTSVEKRAMVGFYA